MKNLNHFLNINQLKNSDILKIVKDSHELKKKYGEKKLTKKKY